jgi:hypothetical protein
MGLSMDNSIIELLSLEGTGAETSLDVGLTESKQNIKLTITGPFVGPITESCAVLFYSCSWHA